MNENELTQALSILRWGTGMPIIVSTAAGLERVRCRGTYSLRVNNFKQLQEKLPEIEQTAAWTGSLIVTQVTNSVGEFGSGLASAHQLTARIDDISKTVISRIKTSLEETGLDLISFSIEAFDIL